MSGEPVEAAEDTSGVKVGVRVGEEVADVRVGGEANVHVGLEAGDGTSAAVGAGVADAEARVGGKCWRPAATSGPCRRPRVTSIACWRPRATSGPC